MKKALAIVSLAAIQLMGCTALTQIQNQSPPAKQPYGIHVKSAIGPNPGWIDIAPNAAGKFPVLPLNSTNNSIQASFFAPFPSSVQIDVDGTALPLKQNLRTVTDAELDSGYYVEVSTQQVPGNTTDFQSTVTIAPPRAKWNDSEIDIHLTDVSINPSYNNTPQGKSQPATITLVTLPRNVVNVSLAGPGTGHVFDSIGALNCGSGGSVCSHDYGANTSSVLLNAEGTGTSIVKSWSGPCAGSNASCTVAMNGSPQNITVTFGPEPDFAPGNFVPVGSISPCGYSVSQNGSAINIMKNGAPVVSYLRRGQGTFSVYFNQNPNPDVCGSAIIIDRGLPNGGPSSHEELMQYTLGLRSGALVNSMPAGAFGKIMQSPDGRVFAISKEGSINPTSWSVDYTKAQGAAPGRLLGSADMNQCDVTMQGNPFPKMQASNNAAVQCYGDPSRPWTVTHLQ